MSDGLDRLPPDVEAMLQAEKSRLSAPTEGRARLADRLAASVPAFGAASAGGVDLLAQAATRASGAKGWIAKTLLVIAVGGGASVAIRAYEAAHAGASPKPNQESLEAAPPDPAKAPPPVTPMIEPTATASAPPATATAVTAARAPSARPSIERAIPAVRHAESSNLVEERRILDAARAAIVRGEPNAALDLAGAHVARFPRGVLSEEREALRVRAFSQLGRKDEARACLEAMRAKYPQSFLLEGAEREVEASQ
jgi:hypothetical protein